MAIFIINSIVFTFIAVFSWKLIKGISQRNSANVSLYKWFVILSRIIIIFFAICNIIGDRDRRDQSQVQTINMISTFIGICWTAYEIYVIRSLEIMYREQQFPIIQPGASYQIFQPQQALPYQVITQQQGFIYQTYGQQPEPIVVSQTYYSPTSQDYNPPNDSLNPPSYESCVPEKI